MSFYKEKFIKAINSALRFILDAKVLKKLEKDGKFKPEWVNPNDEEREELLDMDIDEAYIGWSSMEDHEEIAMFFDDWIEIVKGIYQVIALGADSLPRLLYHAYLFVKSSDSDYGVLLEYGGYNDDGLKYGHQNKVHYAKETGLRFSKMDKKYFQRKFGSLLKEAWFMVTEVHEKMKVRDLIDKCMKKKDWQSVNYLISTNNCQTFVARCCKILHLRRPDRKSLEGNHALGCSIIPYFVLLSLESEEQGISKFFTFIGILQAIKERIVDTSSDGIYIVSGHNNVINPLWSELNIPCVENLADDELP